MSEHQLTTKEARLLTVAFLKATDQGHVLEWDWSFTSDRQIWTARCSRCDVRAFVSVPQRRIFGRACMTPCVEPEE